jgi:imidazole glycerol-phosphate synthase subunit HisH
MEKNSRPTIGCVRYGSGNFSALAVAARLAGATLVPVSTPAQLDGLDGCILPGVGAFGPAASHMAASGVGECLRDKALNDSTFGIFGICLGMQLLGTSSQEGLGSGLGVIDGSSIKLSEGRPRIGWLEVVGDSSTIGPMYFCHGFHFVPSDETVVEQSTIDGLVAAVHSGNIWGTQYHPEKSFSAGHDVLRRFVESLCEAKV